MPTHKSGILLTNVISRLEREFDEVILTSGSPRILSINGQAVNLRVTTKKAGAKYWFDVTPDLYNKVAFFLYACGNAEHIYVFPSNELANMLSNASVGGVNQVPNFTIYIDTHELEPAGQSLSRHDIEEYHNAHSFLRH
ncbi:MAG: hypothetical protein HZC38_07180 [Chloroflexi bacterium]|nr:hypothetical protein [Chloroflexota bacterium]